MSEGAVLAVMLAALGGAVFLLRLPTGVALFLSAMLGSLASGNGLGLSFLTEGSMLYLDPIMIVITSLFFMAVFERSGALGTLNVWVVRTFGRHSFLLVSFLMLLVMFPGMVTGLTAPCVLTTGAMIAPLLLSTGASPATAGAFIATGAFFGMVAPPVNICAMLICGGVDMPYIGFDLPLLAATIPLALLSAYLLMGARFRSFDPDAALALLPMSRYDAHGIKLFLPLLLLLVLMLGEKILPGVIPFLGIPLIFVVSALLGLFTGDKVSIRDSALWATRESLSILALLAGIGAFIEVLTLSGARGWIVINLLSLPDWQLYLGMAILVPLFGGISAYGASVVLGVPILLSLLDRNNILIAAALSMLASIGDFMPPTRLAILLAGPIVGEDRVSRILKRSVWPIVLSVILTLAMIYFANDLAKLFGLA
ncbi:MAG: TRAP transporter large permease subunit [Calditrichaeota bacterium]|nr:TRAP transporter large permease subunit [Calditrichota bacterium]MCB9366941.1 TRAP transporter large permease subunit [Calditrichota bacterium]